jgi:hypothetical protein
MENEHHMVRQSSQILGTEKRREIMNKLWCMILTLLVVLLAFGNGGAQNTGNLLAPYETGDKYFEQFEIGDLIVYFHQRTTPGGAIVEKDFINYQFDKESKELLEKKMNWREDLTGGAGAAPLISGAQAMAMVPGAQFAKLYVISPDSDIFPIKPTPTNPCWIVRSVVDGQHNIYIIDAMTGQDLGRGIAPPYESFSSTGPTDLSGSCTGAWDSWANSARDWFNTMGYPSERINWPTRTTIQTHAIQNPSEVLFYELSHGGYWYYSNACGQSVVPADIKSWIANYRRFPFAFIGSCEGMCETGSNTMSYEFRKGSSDGAATVGYCHMASDFCDSCWGVSIPWQNSLFSHMNAGYTIYNAFLHANADYPTCAGANNCMRFAGDSYLILKTRAEIMGAGGTWVNPGIWYWNLATEQWSHPYNFTPNRPGLPMAIGDINADGHADMISCWTSGLWWQNAVTLGWNFVYSIPPNLVTAGDISGDGRAEIIGTWNGIWNRNLAAGSWTQMFNYVPDGGIAAGDFSGDGRADVASIWASGLWYQNGATLAWTKVYGFPPSKLAAGDTTGDGRAEIVGTWNDGIWYRNLAAGTWTHMYAGIPTGMIAAGDVSGDGRADVVSIWGSGLWYQNGRTLGWTRVYSFPPASIAVGNITGN